MLEDGFGQRVHAGVVYVEDYEFAIWAFHLYSGDIISTKDFDDFPQLSVYFCIDPYCGPNHSTFLPPVGWVDLTESHWHLDHVEFHYMQFL